MNGLACLLRRSARGHLALAGALVLVSATGAACRGRGGDPSAKEESGPEATRRNLTASLPALLTREAEPSGRTHEIDIVAAPTSIELLDGRRISVWAYNGRVPGPTIRVTVGDRLRVRLRNDLPQPTTIHWHGVRLPNAMDGVPNVTQPPVEPGGTFEYDFIARDAGTYWYHPHVRGSEQVERGLHGLLIVEEKAGGAAPREETLVLDDWRLGGDGQIDPNFVTRHDLAHDGRWGNVITVNGSVTPAIRAAGGERLRLRLLNAANGRVFAPDFSALDARVVAFDGLPTERPLPALGLELAPGNRVDVVIRVPENASAEERFIVADQFTRRRNPLFQIVASGPGQSGPEPAYPALPPARWEEGAGLPDDLSFTLAAAPGGPFGLEWSLNGRPMRHDDAAHHAAASHEPYRVKLGRFTKLLFRNDSPRLHPMHLHGNFFKVLSRNGAPVDEGHFRDTVLVRPRELVTVGFVPDAVGKWMLHCHILEHADSGMMTLIEVEP